MSDNLPIICADQLTKAVNLAAAGTLTALDGENDDEEDPLKGKTVREKPFKVTEPSSPLSTLKLLEALSSSMTSNLPKLSQLDSDNHTSPATSFITNSFSNKVRPRAIPQNSTPRPTVKKYSNRKNYKLLPPVIPCQIGAGVRKIRPSSLQQRQQLMTFNPHLKSASANDLIGLQVRPLSVAGSGVMLMSPSISHVSPNLSKPLTGKTTAHVSSISVQGNDVFTKTPSTQSLFIQSKAPLKAVSSLSTGCSNAANLPRQPPSNFQAGSKLQSTFNNRQQLEIKAASQNLVSPTATAFSKTEQCLKEGTLHTAFDPSKAMIVSPICSGERFSQNSSMVQANSMPVSSSTNKEISPNESTGMKTVRDPLKDLASIASKSLYVPILPQPPVDNTTVGRVGQLIFQNGSLQMIQPNGSLQTIAFVHPQIINSPTVDSNQFNNNLILRPGSEKLSTNLDLTVGSSTSAINGHPTTNNSSFPVITMMPPQPNTSTSLLSSSNVTTVTTSKSPNNFVRTTSIPEPQHALSSAKSLQKSHLTFAIAGSPRLNVAQNLQSSVPSTSSESPPRAALQYLAKLLVPQNSSEPLKSLTVITQRKANETEGANKQPTNHDMKIEANNVEVDKNNQGSSLPVVSNNSYSLLRSGSLKFGATLPNQNLNTNTSTILGKTVLSSSTLSTNWSSNLDQVSTTIQPSLPNNLNSHSQASSLPFAHQNLYSECSMFAEQSDAERDNASATAVAAAAMMSLSQTADPMPSRCDTIGTNLATQHAAFSETYIPSSSPSKVSLHESTSLPSYGNVPSLLSSNTSETPAVNADQNSSKAPLLNSTISKVKEIPSQPPIAKQLDGSFLVPSTCGKKLIVSPGGIKHLQSILRQRGMSEGYFVITSPRATHHSSPAPCHESSEPQGKLDVPFGNENHNSEAPKNLEKQNTAQKPPKDKETTSISGVKDKESQRKLWSNVDINNSGSKKILSREDIEMEDSDDSSSISGSSSAALVIETGEEEEQEGAHQSPRNSKKPFVSTQDVETSMMANDQGRDDIIPQAVKTTKTSEVSPCSDVVDKFHDNSCIPQSPLSLSDLVRQQANRSGLLLGDKDPDYSCFKSPGTATKEMFDAVRESSVSVSTGFALPTPVSLTQASPSEHSQQSPAESVIENDIGPDYRRSVFTPGSLLPVDLSYERDSHLADNSRSEHESVLAQSPPKVSTSATNEPSPKSPFMSSANMADHVTPLNPPMTPNTMLINLLNRVPTPLLTNNQDLLTLPSSQESRTFEPGSASKPRISLHEKRDESMHYSEKRCTFNDGQYADSLAANSLFPESRKSMDVEQTPFDPPQNALELIASNYTVANNSHENRPDAVNHIQHFPLQSMDTRDESFERSAYTGSSQSLQREFPVNFLSNSCSEKMYQDSMQSCDHLLVTVNLDSDTPAYTVHVSQSQEDYARASKQPFHIANNAICSHYLTQASHNLQYNTFTSATEDTVEASYTGKSADTDILRHLITSTNTSYPSQSHQTIPEVSNDTSNGNFTLIGRQQQLSHFPPRVYSLFTNQPKTIQSSSAQAEQRLGFSDQADPQFSHTAGKSSSDPPCTFSDTSISFKKAAFPCVISNSQINESLHLHDHESGLEAIENLPYVAENINKPSMPLSHGFKTTGKHIQHFHSDSQDSNIYFNNTPHQASLQTLGQNSEHRFHSSEDQVVNSYEQEQNIQNFVQSNQEQDLASVYEQGHQVYGQADQENLQTYNPNNSQSRMQTFDQNEPQQKSLQDFDRIEHERNLHSFSTAKHPQSIQAFEQHPDPHGINYNMESMPPPPNAPSDHGYSSSSMPPQDSARMFAPQPDQMNYMMDQQYPPEPSTYFTSSTGGGVASTMPSLFSEQCAIGSEAPVLDGGNNHHSHPCSSSFNHASQGKYAL
ncbi:hypothetical protein ElyMa_006780800 [Elysia marginata]|uniref:Uncharacterized protein n=1 Tax=Elysia marginata TaxID=1093978 RepID=A0AAV4IZH5_9GAST|nr:hypothetical protein ElyMa_006780800 [Elysia marginata]